MDFDGLRAQALTFVDAGRVAHVLGCEREAVRLARRWGVNEDDARTAALLHDITKRLDAGEQFTLCKKYDIILDVFEKNEKKLLHAKTGAHLARDIFGVSEEVFNAIAYHTTSRKNASELEKVIYMADYIEPERAFDGVEKLRRLAYERLDEAMISGLSKTMGEMLDRGRILHPDTFEARNWLILPEDGCEMGCGSGKDLNKE